MPDPSDLRLDAVLGVRALAHALSAHDADDELLARVAEAAGSVLPALEAAPRRERILPRFGEIVVVTPDARRRHPMDDRAVAGPANPTAVEFASRREGDDAVADVEFGPAFEGAPGRVHGGMVAAVFDDLVGFVLAVVGEPGFTGRLAVEYRAPVPTETMIEFRARLRERDGRKLHVDAEARLANKVLATAEATMILVAPEHWSKHARELLDD
jgi:acyl-coenzyme A thioesterase PaaI-like protein